MKIAAEVSVFLSQMRAFVFFAAIISIGALPQLAEAQGGSTFSASERARLSRGQLVTRREEQQRGELRLIGGTSWQVVDVPPEVLWQAVLDVSNWTEFLPQAVESRLVREAPGRRDVYIRHEKGPVSASYTVRLEFVDGRRMARFRMDTSRRSAIRDGWGFFIVQPFGDDKSMVSFGVLADVGTGLISGLARPAVHEWMLRVPSELKRHVESRYRHHASR